MKALLRSLRYYFGYTRSYSQFGEDAFIQAIFKKKRHGIYLDIGAYHPILYSNTYALYRKGWSGVVVDPNPLLKRLYRVFRHRDIFENTAIGNGSPCTYYQFSDGAYNTLDSATAEALRQKHYPIFLGTTTVPSASLDDIVRKHKLDSIDYLNVDVEGMDFTVLQSYDWSVFPSLISVENSHPDLHLFLAERGYTKIGSLGRTLLFKHDLEQI